MGVQIVDLPDLVLFHIITFLSLVDLKNLRLVSKKFREVVGNGYGIWKIRIFRVLPDENIKVIKGMKKIELVIDSKDKVNRKPISMEQFEAWLVKHSRFIIGLSMVNYDPDGRFQFVREDNNRVQDLDNIDEKNLLTADMFNKTLDRIGPQLETLNIVNYEQHDTCFLSRSRISNLKQVQLCSNKRYRDQFLAKLPDSIESLHIQSPGYLQNEDDNESDIVIPYIKSLKTLKISHPCGWSKNLSLREHELSSSLTGLYLNGIDLFSYTTSIPDLPELKVIGFIFCRMNWVTLNELLMKSSRSLSVFIWECSYIKDHYNLRMHKDSKDSLPRLTTFKSDSSDVSVCSKLISMCSRSLTTLVYSCGRDQLNCDLLPALKTLSISIRYDYNENEYVTNFLKKCPSLQTLHLAGNKKYKVKFSVNFETDLPNLKELYLGKVKVQGIKNLALPGASKIETIGLRGGLEGPIWTEIVECSFPNLKAMFMHDLTKEQVKVIKNSIVTADMKVFFEDWQDDDWSYDAQYGHVRYSELKRCSDYLHETMKTAREVELPVVGKLDMDAEPGDFWFLTPPPY